jgi:hypothetical protein
MNELLLLSSIICGLVMLSFECNVPTYPVIITYIGIITSILNHGTSSIFCKYLDRLIIAIAAIIYLVYVIDKKEYNLIGLILLNIMLYILSKYCEKETGNKIHALAHFLTVLLFYLVIKKLPQ